MRCLGLTARVTELRLAPLAESIPTLRTLAVLERQMEEGIVSAAAEALAADAEGLEDDEVMDAEEAEGEEGAGDAAAEEGGEDESGVVVVGTLEVSPPMRLVRSPAVLQVSLLCSA
jgi:hypothetical protein